MKSKKVINLISIFCCVGVFLWTPVNASAVSSLKVNVEVIKADRTSTNIDPQLEGLVKELGPLLNFTGFSLLKKSEMKLKLKEKTEIILSTNRLLELEFLEFSDNQARLQVRILEKDKETFRTILLLVDKGTALIGGPTHEDGVLLLRIGGAF